MTKIWMLLMFLVLVAAVTAAEPASPVLKLTLPTGQTVVVAEGELEARSIGSFSVRLYQAAVAPDETTFFLAGIIRPRDGVLEKAVVADVVGDDRPEIIVIARSVGTGSFQSAYVFEFTENTLRFRTQLDGLVADEDPIAALRTSTAKGD
ncbi:PliI family lysozyme inhibitor of I-type lysozyme [uncultured Oceanisphaera sp.]|uniref:PliI family lysozyme inhibitor of I-type lysozyme n=1 Tax=uncultured Oceanisphaera sp. TaxID=353858 RepID=UPI002634C59E|nr:PliI family lysozyme inhibitor of I-type lysozyme [uncultured Oceanisphaera sp.]